MICTILLDVPQCRTDLKLMCNLHGLCENELGYESKYKFINGFDYSGDIDLEIYRINFIASFLDDKEYQQIIENKIA